MTDLDQREKAFEDFFSHKHELEIVVKAKAYYKLGLWVAKQLVLMQQEESYALSLVVHEYEQNNKIPVVDKIINDFKVKNIDFNKLALLDKLEEFTSESRRELFGSEAE